MSLNLNNLPQSKGSSTAETLEDGGYPARLVGVVELGIHQPTMFDKATNTFVPNPDKRLTPFAYLQYELSDEFMKDADGNELEDKPRWFGEKLALYSLKSEQANSTKRVKAIDPKNEANGDLTKMLSFPCTLLIHKNQTTGKNKIGSVSAIIKMKGYTQPELKNKPFVLTFDNPDMEVFEKLPDWLKEEITSAENFEGSNLQKILSGEIVDEGNQSEEQSTTLPVDSEDSNDEDNIPW